ncbi:MAG: hypothetical protein A3A94_03255 [Candidatus Portnoybacteria bacterium RIFCSPLOWO2_01_FULL_43_11]|uniref:Uncharacterized protein n=3 Tax=Bacteria candidate phyla TaxID=1783234 RepID=A0A1G2FHI8_9BACT|nr:MAG: hypothetical protein A2713_02310 [candidate division WWE3 bacterium RIFCSPHIGHO2_01_FULL_35_17]OGZ37554.1 MAG: hypothetical protein A3E90_00265 [Candidatus Portnoybacteria bacterium RIFCSPHIGHO2_12_FULL_40_11]OGZ38909.1 MAG: hypothetical protein A3A94_03255 [Candidatus Portnoybacteria bacterium RIFCSPLOWO2_01_FULL_43_11]
MEKIIAIYGPTTSNKLGLVFNLSKYLWGKYRINSEVINADSRKIYKDFKISQSLPIESFFKKIKLHLFGTISAKEKIDLYDFQKIVRDKIIDVQQKNNLPILVGGSSIHLLCVLQNWKKGEKRIRKEIPSNVLTLGVAISRKELKKSVGKNISEMFRKGLYSEFKILYKKSQKGELSEELLKETLGYRQFLEMAKVSNKSPLELNTKDLIKIKKWIIKDILKYAYHQSLDYKKFPNIHLIRGFKQSKKIVDSFLNH